MTGFGKVAAAVSHGGTGTASSITATGGTLEVTGAVTGINTLAIGSGATDKLLLDGASSTATAVTFSGSTGTIEINTAGSLTVTNALAVGANTVKLDGASSTLTDGNGITLAGGTISGLGHLAANTNVTGYGTISIPISTADTITASGGTLDLTNAITTNSTLDIANSSASILKLDGNVSSSSTLLAFLGSAGTIELTDVVGGALQFSGNIAGLNVGSSSTIPTNDVNVQGLTITSATLSGSSIILQNGTTTVGTLALATAPAAGTYVALSSDATLGGTDVFLTAPTTVTWSPSTETGVEGSAINLGTVTPASTNTLSAVVLSGIPVGATLSDNNGHSSSGSTSVNILGWNYAGLTITAANDTNLILAVQVTDTAGNVSTIATESVTVNPLAATVTPVAATGVEGSVIALNLAVTVNGLSGDANSLATLTLSGATAGAVLTDGINTHTFTGPSDTFDIHTWNLSTLTIKPASDANFTLTVAATEMDAEGNLGATTTTTDAVTVNPLAATVTPVAATGVEGSAIALNLGVTVNGLSGDANSLATLTLSGATAGAVLTDGINTHTFTGPSDTIDIHTWNLSTLTIKPASDTNFTLTVAATEKDAAGNLGATTTTTDAVTVNPLAATVTPVAATGVEGSAIALNLGVTVNGLSGDANSLAKLTLSGATAGAVLTDGINTHTFTGPSDTFDIHTWNLSTLTINAASAANFTLTVAATEQDAAGNFSTPTINTEVVTINAGPLVTTPTSLTVAENSGATPIGIVPPSDANYAASALSVTVTGLPTDGTVRLSDGTTPVTIGESLTVAQLTGLMFKPAQDSTGQSSTFTYSVSDPAANSANGSVTLATGPNAIVLENEKPGTPQSVWQISPGQDSTTIQGFTTSMSTNVGGDSRFQDQ